MTRLDPLKEKVLVTFKRKRKSLIKARSNAIIVKNMVILLMSADQTKGKRTLKNHEKANIAQGTESGKDSVLLMTATTCEGDSTS
jgi:hypothetical protein